MNKAQVFEFYSRLADANPAPETELEYSNPFTLLVAVVLSPSKSQHPPLPLGQFQSLNPMFSPLVTISRVQLQPNLLRHSGPHGALPQAVPQIFRSVMTPLMLMMIIILYQPPLARDLLGLGSSLHLRKVLAQHRSI